MAAQIRREPLDRLAARFGGTVLALCGNRPEQRDYWRWQLTGSEKVARCITALLPFLTTKREEAVVLLAICRMKVPHGRRLTDGELAGRLDAVEELRRLRAA